MLLELITGSLIMLIGTLTGWTLGTATYTTKSKTESNR